MKTIAKPFIFILCLTFFYSCGNVPQVSRKKVIGSWKLDQLVSVGDISDTNNRKATTDRSKPAAKSSRELKVAMVDAQKGDFAKFSDLFPETKNEMEFRADNTASMTIHGNLLNGTWQMNEKMNGLIFTLSDKSKIINLSIAGVNSNSMQVDEPTDIGVVRLSYTKK